jgi:demethylspheroidene O-methyltransferase
MIRATAWRPWLDRCLEFRNRWLASPRFQRWATRFPPTRWIARRRARRVFDLCAGFVYSQVLLACVRLRLFEALAAGPATTGDLAARLALSPEAVERLLQAAASLGLVEVRGAGRFGLGALGAVVAGSPAIRAMVEHHALLYADLADPVALLRGAARPTALGRYWAYADSAAPTALGDAAVARYSALMAVSQSLIADQVLDAHPLDRCRCLLDVGGGEGAFLIAAGARTPRLRLWLFDLPAVAARARERLAAAGLADRATAFGGDFRTDPLPTGADVVSLVRVLHDHDDTTVLSLLRAVRKALPDDGTLLVAEPMAGTAGAEPVGDAYFGFYLLAMGSGRARRPEEIEALLHVAGFGAVRLLPTALPLQTRLLVARPAVGRATAGQPDRDPVDADPAARRQPAPSPAASPSRPRRASCGSAWRNQGV